jgi:trimeric autotransporter adhesin
VAQDDRNLAAEWGLSNFDRRHQFSGSANVELPWGRNRRWLSGGGWLATLAGDWSMATTITVQSGTPLTVRCSTCAADVARGVGGTLRADYSGAPVSVSNPTIDQFFNTAAFSVPAPGTFGNSARNLIIGPGSRQLNAQFTRDVALGGNRNVSINVNATNLLNLVNYGTVDTNVNSPTFGDVLSVRGRRTVRLNLRFRF